MGGGRRGRARVVSTASDVRHALEVTAGALRLAAPAIPAPFGVVVQVAAVALGSAASLIDQGQTPEQVIAAMHHARVIDTSATDAAVDALVAAKPSARHEEDGS